MDEKLKEKLDRLEQIRKARDMTKGEFAENELEISRQAYHMWLNGKRKPGWNNALKILNYLRTEEKDG